VREGRERDEKRDEKNVQFSALRFSFQAIGQICITFAAEETDDDVLRPSWESDVPRTPKKNTRRAIESGILRRLGGAFCSSPLIACVGVSGSIVAASSGSDMRKRGRGGEVERWRERGRADTKDDGVERISLCSLLLSTDTETNVRDRERQRDRDRALNRERKKEADD
jgi:hypothetical protein